MQLVDLEGPESSSCHALPIGLVVGSDKFKFQQSLFGHSTFITKTTDHVI